MSWQNFVVSTFLKYRMKPLSKRGLDVAKARAATAKPAVPARVPPGWRLRPSLAAPLKGEWIEPDGGSMPARTLLYLHGGGYFFCSPETHRPITVALATQAEARVFSLDYRLAPEHRFRLRSRMRSPPIGRCSPTALPPVGSSSAAIRPVAG